MLVSNAHINGIVVPDNRRSSAGLRNLESRSFCRGAWHAPSELPGDQVVRQFVLVIGLAGKMSCQDLAAMLDRLTDSFARSIGSHSLGDCFRDLLPGRGPDFSVNTAVGEDFHSMFEKRNENQYPRMIPRVMKAVLGK